VLVVGRHLTPLFPVRYRSFRNLCRQSAGNPLNIANKPPGKIDGVRPLIDDDASIGQRAVGTPATGRVRVLHVTPFDSVDLPK
jgi:hypothetical protein